MTQSVEQVLAHHGIKGMKWGVRKPEHPRPAYLPPVGVKVGKDGSMRIDKGVDLQRLVKSKSQGATIHDVTYASFTEYDNAKYVDYIGGKGLFGGKRDQVLTMKAQKPIIAPSVDEAAEIVSDLYIKDPKFRTSADIFGMGGVTDKDLAAMKADKKGKVARSNYSMVNAQLTFDPTSDPKHAYVQAEVRKAFLAKGYNALRDENDYGSKLTKAPVVLLDPKNTIKVTTVTDVTDELRKSSKETLARYKSMGKDWAEQELYDK